MKQQNAKQRYQFAISWLLVPDRLSETHRTLQFVIEQRAAEISLCSSYEEQVETIGTPHCGQLLLLHRLRYSVIWLDLLYSAGQNIPAVTACAATW